MEEVAIQLDLYTYIINELCYLASEMKDKVFKVETSVANMQRSVKLLKKNLVGGKARK